MKTGIGETLLLHTPINKDTNIDQLATKDVLDEAKLSKNRVRVQLLQRIHEKLNAQINLEGTYEYDPDNDMSFSGEFEAIGV